MLDLPLVEGVGRGPALVELCLQTGAVHVKLALSKPSATNSVWRVLHEWRPEPGEARVRSFTCRALEFKAPGVVFASICTEVPGNPTAPSRRFGGLLTLLNPYHACTSELLVTCTDSAVWTPRARTFARRLWAKLQQLSTSSKMEVTDTGLRFS